MNKIKSVITAAVLSVMAIVPCAAANGEAASHSAVKASGGLTGKKVLVAYFSRAGENYGVGHVDKGNTQVLAEMIAEQTGAATFHIEPVVPYADDYDGCVEQAKKEKEAGARPAIKGDVKVEDYDVIFLGYPNWWADCPMAVYTFIERHKWAGKVVMPFCTHEGSGLSGTEASLRKACAGAVVKKGLALRGRTAQKDRETAKEAVQKWIANM